MSTESLLWTALQAFLPQLGLDLTLKGKPGKIINMSSIYGSYTLPFSVRQFYDPLTAYSDASHAVARCRWTPWLMCSPPI